MHFKSFACAVLALLVVAPDAKADLELVTRRDPSFPPSDAAGAEGGASISADGRYVAFASSAPNLSAGQEDRNHPYFGSDVFLRDMVAGTTILVSRSASSPNQTGNGGSYSPAISADGRYVAFVSGATDLVPGQIDANGEADIFLYDRITGTTVLVSRSDASASETAENGSSLVAINADGGFVLFVNGQLAFGPLNTFLYDRGAGTVALVSHVPGSPGTPANGSSPEYWGPRGALSADGRFVAFNSTGTNLVSGVTDGNNNSSDAFLYDRTTGLVTLLSRSVADPANTANGFSWAESISADGEIIALTSSADDLIAGLSDENFAGDVFLYRRSMASMTLVSRSSSSATTTGSGNSAAPRLSGDGSRVAFESFAMDMIPGGGPSSSAQVFLYDMPTGAMTLVSRSSSSASMGGNAGSSPPLISADGSRVAFSSNATNLLAGQVSAEFFADAFLYDAVSGSLALVSRSSTSPLEGAGISGYPVLSPGGGHVIFSSWSGAVAPDAIDTDKKIDAFLYSAAAGSIATVSVRDPDLPSITTATQSLPAQISADGRFLAFTSDGDQFIPGQVNKDDEDSFGLIQPGVVFLYDRQLGTTALVSHAAGSPSQPANNPANGASVSAAGNYVLFESGASDLVSGMADANNAYDLFLWQRATGTTTLVSHAAGSPGTPADLGGRYGSLSADGRYIALLSSSTDLIPGFSGDGGILQDDAYLIDRIAGTTSLITGAEGSPTQGTANTSSVQISAGGRYVVFQSYADNLIAGQQDPQLLSSDVFVWDRVTATTQLVSRAAGSATQTAQGSSFSPSISADGRYISFGSSAPDLVSGFSSPFPGQSNVYLHDRVTGLTQLVSRTSASATVGAGGFFSRISDDGRFVTFLSYGTNLVPGQAGPAGAVEQAYLFDRVSGAMTLVSHAAGALATAADGRAANPRVSADGRFVSFASTSTNLIPGQNGPAGEFLFNAFIHDRITGATRLASGAGASLTQTGNESSFTPLFSADGSAAAFASSASNLVEDDYLGAQDIFLSTTPAAGTDFHTAVPCRVLDTRSGSAPVSGVPRLVTVAGVCGIPAAARAVAVNVTAVGSTGNGYVDAYPGYLESTGTSTVSFKAGTARASSAILPLALNGTGTLSLNPSVAGGGTVHLILDVSGWFE